MRMLKPFIVLTLALACAGAGLAVHALVRTDEAPEGSATTHATFGGLRLTVPNAFLRGGGSGPGAPTRLDLVFTHPAYGPEPRRRLERAADLAQAARARVFVALMRSDEELDPAERPQDLYGRFLEADAWRNPGGLLLRRFQAGSPYDDEELYLAPPDGRAFAARCRKPGLATEGIGESCIWRIRRDGADLQVRFSPDLLPEWEAMARGLSRRLDEWVR